MPQHGTFLLGTVCACPLDPSSTRSSLDRVANPCGFADAAAARKVIDDLGLTQPLALMSDKKKRKVQRLQKQAKTETEQRKCASEQQQSWNANVQRFGLQMPSDAQRQSSGRDASAGQGQRAGQNARLKESAPPKQPPARAKEKQKAGPYQASASAGEEAGFMSFLAGLNL